MLAQIRLYKLTTNPSALISLLKNLTVILIASSDDSKKLSAYLRKINEDHFIIGEITKDRDNESGITYIKG